MVERRGESKTDRIGDLAELVTVERRLELQLQEARRQAGAILAEVSESCAARRRVYDEEAAAAKVSLKATIEQARQVESDRLMAAGAARSARYDQATDLAVTQLADLVLRHLLDGTHS